MIIDSIRMSVEIYERPDDALNALRRIGENIVLAVSHSFINGYAMNKVSKCLDHNDLLICVPHLHICDAARRR